jgi:hypothetical protein
VFALFCSNLKVSRGILSFVHSENKFAIFFSAHFSQLPQNDAIGLWNHLLLACVTSDNVNIAQQLLLLHSGAVRIDELNGSVPDHIVSIAKRMRPDIMSFNVVFKGLRAADSPVEAIALERRLLTQYSNVVPDEITFNTLLPLVAR